MTLKLPDALEPFRQQLLQTQKSFIRIKPQSAAPSPLWASKVGGMPYLPKNTPWPINQEGKPLCFLTQINFAETPRLEPFPQKGILQFFIQDDDLYGMDFDNGACQDSFRVCFYPDITHQEGLLHTKMPINDWDEDMLPHHPEESYPLQFSLEQEIVPITDYRFYDYFGQDFFRQFGKDEWEIMAQFEKSLRTQGHKLGGYAYFTQDDPRTLEDPMLLLLQLDSDELMDLMWGDMGVGHFFIREMDLKALDFSRVLYDWDCL